MTATALAEGRAKLTTLFMMILILLNCLLHMSLFKSIAARCKRNHHGVESKEDSKYFHGGVKDSGISELNESIL